MTKRTITPEAKAALRALATADRKARVLDDQIFALATTALAGGLSFKEIGAAHTPPLTAPASRSRFEGGEAGRDHRRAQARLRSRERTEVLARVTQENAAA
jgi:hypothetical protein